ncbi:MAG: ribonuclease HIII [Erysipelotrichaceae bacterium]|nr:ribonuclease HIII [Erysipelotrichaceae bacterium]
MSEVITLVLSPEERRTLYEAWKDTASERVPPYGEYQLRPENCVITAYTSGKVVFQGKDAEVYASPFRKELRSHPHAKKPEFPQAGSDEVGTGDYFGPVCVCACIVQESDLGMLKELGVRDSKALTDAEIRKIAPKLMQTLRYSLLIVNPEKYNQVHASSNMNAIKAKLHNQAYVNLSQKTRLPDFRIIDQFAPEPQYYHYLMHEKTVIRGITFETRAENKYPAVGSASVIARYAFLVSMDEMEKKYRMKFQKGAGTKVDDCALEFVNRFGMDQLSEVAKLHFRNTEKLHR